MVSRTKNMPALIMTAIVRIRTGNGEFIQGRTLLDTCSTAHLVTEKFAKKLHLPSKSGSITINAINTMQTISRSSIEITFYSQYSNFQKTLSFLIIPKIIDFIPSEAFPRELIDIPSHLNLADPLFHIPNDVDLLIGAGATLSMFRKKRSVLNNIKTDLVLQETELGWAFASSSTSSNTCQSLVNRTSELSSQIAKFWEMEEMYTEDNVNDEGRECESHYVMNVSRNDSGRYTVRLPFREGIERDFKNTKTLALRRFHGIENKFKDPFIKQQYNNVMQEYLDLGHMIEVSNTDDDGYFMPHHAVIKNSSLTTKVRVVFDASAKVRTGKSLNETLMVGPTIQNSIFEHILRFRQFKYVLIADIEKMYRQILVHKDDRKYQKILWRKNGSIKTFELNTVTFGVSSAPFLAIRTLHQLAEDEALRYPKGSFNLKNRMYVDDLITGANSIQDLQEIRNEIIDILKEGGFNIRQWVSNNAQALNDLTKDSIHFNLLMDKESELKTLGIYWNNKIDQMSYKVNSIQLTSNLTKRNILSQVAKIYDPLGLLGPIIMYAKCIMQWLWKCKISWDEPVPNEIRSKWYSFSQQFHMIENISIERYAIVDNPCNIELHGFCDASQYGYGACIYIKTKNTQGESKCQLLCAKSRVAPIKELTIPRLELCAASILAKLYQDTIKVIDLKPNDIFLWSDSMIVIHWINMQASKLKPFVANRVTSILKMTLASWWCHVASENNPADALSRGQMPKEFVNNQKWFTGPLYIKRQEFARPTHSICRIDVIPEIRKTTCLSTTTSNPEFFGTFSSYRRLIHVTAWCLRFRRLNVYKGLLSVQETNEAEIRILNLIQANVFNAEIKCIKKCGELKGNRLSFFCPFIDNKDLLRIGGRLEKADIQFSAKHPIILPSRHHVTDLIIRECHIRNHHAGIQTTLGILRQKFWILDGKNQVRHIIRKCIRCIRFRADTNTYQMANLPKVRIQDARPFKSVGIDYCGPFYLKEKKYRNRNKVKTYASMFICMVTRAVHIEIVTEMTTQAFLAALKRFVSRRGVPSDIYSDNGPNFIGAKNELQELYLLHHEESFKTETNNYALSKGINWHFSVPLTPHFGGIWEAAVKTYKHHLKRVVGSHLYTYEEFITLAIEIEAIMNSRPICSLSSDPNDPMALTPAHFLLGQPLTMIPEEDVTTVPQNRLTSWRLITQARQHFWKRWYIEYLHELQRRQKWTTKTENIKVGNVVIIKEKGLPCMQWALGRVLQVFTGSDGIVRAALLKTSTTTVKRCVKLLCNKGNTDVAAYCFQQRGNVFRRTIDRDADRRTTLE
ncbi:uncharacterized protein [Prorops nasuta]|uniref:uncharacterized protein n=1 Tax=Prorops nasuta TaxID=863751 RepID=UPI0034CFCA9D